MADTTIPRQEAIDAAEQAAETLEPEVTLAASELDPLNFGKAVAAVGRQLSLHPRALAGVTARFVAGVASTAPAAAARLLGQAPPGPVAPGPKDRRFSDPTWDRNPAFFSLQELYLLTARALQDAVDRSGVDGRAGEQARFALQLVADAFSPTNFLPTNPAALKRAFETGGLSVLRGAGNMLQDVLTNGGMPRQVDTTQHRVGENMAVTPGKVVFRNDLMELLQYSPATETVHEIPVLCSPPWINKFYIMDLGPGRSFVEWAVNHGHTVFAISYRNPDASMRDVALDDYLVEGPRQAIDVIQDITGAPQVNVVGLCLGGTLTAMMLAYLAEVGDQRVRSATLLNTLIDFSEPGLLGVFTDPATVNRLEKTMEAKGFLDAADMARTFDLLRANDLIWNYVASNWLMGEDPPAFDLLTWNADSTRMPAAMHTFYLRSCYLENRLARGLLELEGVRLRLEDVTEDIYLLAAAEDHIVPWTASYAATKLLKGDVRFVLSSSGHIAGIVNPPSPKAKYWTNSTLGMPPDDWRDGAVEHKGSWWEDWANWISERSGERREPPPMGSSAHPVLGDAPGRYVLDK